MPASDVAAPTADRTRTAYAPASPRETWISSSRSFNSVPSTRGVQKVTAAAAGNNPWLGSSGRGSRPQHGRRLCRVLACAPPRGVERSRSMATYSELRLRIDRGVARGSYRMVATGTAGEALGRFKLPVSELELENFILRVGTTRRGRRRVDSPEMELAKGFGTKLFGALFSGDVRELYRSSLTEARSEGQGLRVTLSLTGAPELLQVPWEYMYDHPSFLSISTWTPIVRYLDLPKPRRPLQVALPIRILAMVSSPNDAEVIDARLERAKLEGALAPLIDIGAITVDWLDEASLRALQRRLRKADYHVFHFIGHGGYDHDADDGVLLFEDDVGRGRRVSGVP